MTTPPSSLPGSDGWVWTTRGGSKYHVRPDCPALVDGQRQAQARSLPVHPPQAAARSDAVAAGRTPCNACRQPEAVTGESPWPRTIGRLYPVCETKWERDFLTAVLPNVDGLDPATLRVQFDVLLTDGGRRRLDFAVLPPDGRKIALEVNGLTPEKESSLNAAGWHVLRFMNDDVTNTPQACIDRLEQALHPTETRAPATTQAAVAAAAAAADNPSTTPEEHGQAVGQQPRSRRPALLLAVPALAVAGVAGAVLLFSGGDTATAPLADGSCPANAPLKGNINDDDERIYHSPEQRYYAQTNPEKCFATPEAAEAAGFRAAKI